MNTIFRSTIEHIARQLENEPNKKPRLLHSKELYARMERYLFENYNQGYYDLQKEIGKGGILLDKKQIEHQKDKRLARKCKTLLEAIRNTMFDRMGSLTPRYIELQGGLVNYMLNTYGDGLKTLKSDITSYVIGGYGGGRGQAIQDSVEIIEELQYVGILDKNICDKCAPFDGLRMSVEEALDHGLQFAPNGDGISVAVNPDCKGWLGGNSCRCQLVPVSYKQVGSGEIKPTFEEIDEQKRRDMMMNIEGKVIGKDIHQVKLVEKDYFMEMTPNGELSVSTGTFKELNGFNPAKELNDAIVNMRQGKELTFHQEYAIENLKHELQHRQTPYHFGIKADSIDDILLETANQLVARRTYGELMRDGTAHSSEVIQSGYGYRKRVQLFRDVLKELAIDEDVAIPEIKDLVLKKGKYEGLEDRIMNMKNGVKNQIIDILRRLSNVDIKDIDKLIDKFGD